MILPAEGRRKPKNELSELDITSKEELSEEELMSDYD